MRNLWRISEISLIPIAAVLLAGCGQELPENPKGAPRADPAMAQARIKATQDDPRFTQAQKDQIIATIKQKNHIQ